ncbi:unnamed protein product [Periconia digitata]|uniref:Uncharacterized protein n=1 Tax=Periconia digitata TaxID=1303443 RepID=A0A9W4XF08_9PLEO|nr:unnamed protein product [Periconia digitata]
MSSPIATPGTDPTASPTLKTLGTTIVPARSSTPEGTVVFFQIPDVTTRVSYNAIPAPTAPTIPASGELSDATPLKEIYGFFNWNSSNKTAPLLWLPAPNDWRAAKVVSSMELPWQTSAETSDTKTAAPTSTQNSTPTSQSTKVSTPVSTSVAASPHFKPVVAKPGLSNGAIVGIAIGSFIGGALIAALLFWIMAKKKKPSKTSDSEASTVHVPLVAREKMVDAKTISISSSSPILYHTNESVGAQPLEDKAISGEISKISNLIKNHVQSYYHTKTVSAGMIDYDDLSALGPGLPVSVGTLGTLLGSAATREIALRFCIAWVVTSRIQLHESSHRSFLPLEISECLQSMSPQNWDSKVHASLLAKWRVITSELLQSAYVRNAFSLDDSRIHNIQGAVGVLDNVLRPYIDTRMDNGQRSRNLEEILKRAAQFAFTLFSQRSEWDFDWQIEEQNASSEGICVFPALVQVLDEHGEVLKPARPFSEAVVRRLDE